MAEDLRELAVSLRDLLSGWGAAPTPTAANRALADAWTAIIAVPGRLPQWTSDWKELASAGWWAKDEDGVALYLEPKRWQAARAHLGQTYAGLFGALSQYLGFRPLWRERLWFGLKNVPNAPLGSRAEVAKARDAQAKKAEEERKKAAEFYKHVLDEVLKGLEQAQSRLVSEMENVVKLAVRMEEAEEKRLAAGLAAARGLAPDLLRQAKATLSAMRDLRLDTAAFDGKGAELGSLLDRWLGGQRKVAALL